MFLAVVLLLLMDTAPLPALTAGRSSLLFALDSGAALWVLFVILPPVPIMLLPSGLPGALVPAEVLEVAAKGLVAFFMLGSKFLIHLQRNLALLELGELPRVYPNESKLT